MMELLQRYHDRHQAAEQQIKVKVTYRTGGTGRSPKIIQFTRPASDQSPLPQQQRDTRETEIKSRGIVTRGKDESLFSVWFIFLLIVVIAFSIINVINIANSN